MSGREGKSCQLSVWGQIFENLKSLIVFQPVLDFGWRLLFALYGIGEEESGRKTFHNKSV